MKCLSLKKYLNETSLHGFGYTDDKNVFFVIFWAVLTAVCVAAAIRDITGLVQTYQSVPGSVGIEVAPNENLNLITPTLCMEFSLAEAESFSIADINSDIKAFMAATNNGMNLTIDSSEMNLTNRLEYLTYLMLGYITDFELLYTGDQRPMLTAYVNQYQMTDNAGTNIGSQTLHYISFIQPVYDAYMSYKVSLGNLKRLVGMSICRKQIGSAHYSSLDNNSTNEPVTSICQPDTITHLSFSLLCIKLFNSSTFTLTDGLTVSLLNLSSSSTPKFPGIRRPKKCGATQTPVERYVKFMWRLDLQGRSVTPQLSLKDIVSLDPALPGTRLEVSVASAYQFVNVPTIRDCSNDELQRDCIWRKTVEKMSQTCSCWPSTLINVVNSNKMPTCSDNPTNPSKNITGNNNYLKCSSNVSIGNTCCLPDCNNYLYSVAHLNVKLAFNLMDIGGGQQIRKSGGSVEIKFQSASDRYLFAESLTMPLTSFACSFGGIIGTYLGGSILAFVHIPIFIIAQLTNLWGKRKKVEHSDEADAKNISMTKEEIYPPITAEAKFV